MSRNEERIAALREAVEDAQFTVDDIRELGTEEEKRAALEILNAAERAFREALPPENAFGPIEH